MELSNLEEVPGKKILEHYGIVMGNTIRAKNFIKDFGAGLKGMIGGELNSYTELMSESRREAAHRMMTQAHELGANAIVNIRFATSTITTGAAEILAYGTAVKVED